ncbi:GNAT family N-acetyltransferase [Pleionea sp. CnH1-48]|uniref:GNAT family N-acetyltransferase n=1 Tax=Pleionea sp. CnH1-48 TaxID=2954494 RepID=UPI0020980271|nr:GNAT family N-acetyltransferase [Pleionea sp. CnH1-48]MCO7223398.1 GNAT family N-acetyltransferase [Pleionea sp. CnH1-48]
MNSITISFDKSLLNLAFVHEFLSEKSYWARGRSLQTVEKTIQHSFCAGAYWHGEQVGFARVVTDYQTVGYIMDVLVSPDMQLRGIGSQLIQAILNAPQLEEVTRFALRTKSANEFYKNLGFKTHHSEQLVFERGNQHFFSSVIDQKGLRVL